MSAHFLPNCPVCGKFHENITSNCRGCNTSLWRHTTPTQSNEEPCKSLGDSDSQRLLNILDQVTVLHSKFVGTCFDLSANGPNWMKVVGLESPDQYQQDLDAIGASFAELKQRLFRCYIRAKSVEANLTIPFQP